MLEPVFRNKPGGVSGVIKAVGSGNLLDAQWLANRVRVEHGLAAQLAPDAASALLHNASPATPAQTHAAKAPEAKADAEAAKTKAAQRLGGALDGWCALVVKAAIGLPDFAWQTLLQSLGGLADASVSKFA